MKIAFRTDASPVIGTGHVMRCLTLARALRDRGAECVFLHRRHEGHMAGYIEEQGFRVLALPEPEIAPVADNHRSWLGVDAETDAAQTLQALGDLHPDWLVVDHYAINALWEYAVREKAAAIAVIDDLADRLHDCHLLVDQNYCDDPESRYANLLPDDAHRCIGPRYALLRPEFREAREGPTTGPVRRVFVSFGGVDSADLAGAALAALEQPAFEHIAVDIVVGAAYPYREALERRANLRPATIVHGPQPHLAKLMRKADIAIGAGGTTTWERCALGLPAIVVAIAGNQVALSHALDEAGAIWFLGHHAELPAPEEAIELALDTLCNDDDARADMATAAWRMTDGLGAERLAELLRPTETEQLRMRRAEARDMALFHDWASDPATRAHAFHPEPIPWNDHVAWFQRKLADSDSALYVAETPHGLPVGQARLDRGEDGVLLSYSIDPACRGRGWGSRLLELAIAQWREHWPDEPLHAETRPDNEASIRALQRTGFVEQHRTADRICFRFAEATE